MKKYQRLFSLGVLLLASPFLLFPSYSVAGSGLALGLVLALLITQRLAAATPLHLPLALFGFMIVVGILASADPDLTVAKATSLVLGMCTLYFMLNAIRKHSELCAGAWLFVGLGLGFVGIGMLGVNWVVKLPILAPVISLLPVNLIALPGEANEGIQANQLAATLIIFWPLLMSLAFMRHGRVRSLASILAIGVLAVLILTQSRTGWIAAFASVLFVGTATVWLEMPRYRRQLLYCWGLLLLAALALGLQIGPVRLGQILLDPTEGTVIGNLSTLGFRLETWHWAIEAIHNFPFTGTGLGTFRRMAVRFFPIQVPANYDIAHAHNIFLQVALDVGLPGLIAYLAILLLAFWEGWQSARLDKALRPYALGLLGGLVALHIFGLTDALALGAKPGLLFWINIGLLTAMRQVRQADRAGPSAEPS